MTDIVLFLLGGSAALWLFAIFLGSCMKVDDMPDAEIHYGPWIV